LLIVQLPTGSITLVFDKTQFRQTLISTGAIGALFGSLPVLALLAFRNDYGHAPRATRSLFALGLDLCLLFFGSVTFCIFFFGVLPMALHYAFVWTMRRWTGRD